MDGERNKALLRATYDRWWNAGDLDAVDDMVAEDYVDHGAAVTATGREGLKELIREFRQGFPDMVEELEDVIAEGDPVRIVDGRIVVMWYEEDALGMMRQLGVVA